jgi:hypothetical protein
MVITFALCTNLVNAPVIPNSVTDTYALFAGCSNLSGDIIFESENISNAYNCFEETALDKNVYIPFTYANGVNTLTYNAFKDAGYSNDTRKDGALLMDINYDPELLNWRYKTLNNGIRLLQGYLGTESNISVPNKKTMIGYGGECPFDNNQQIISVDLNKTSVEYNSMTRMFDNCTNLINVTNINENVVSMLITFTNCVNLVNAPVIPNSVTNMYGTFINCHNLVNAPVIPNSVIDMSGTFRDCSNLVNAPVIPNSVTDMDGTFFGCSNLVNTPVIPNSVIDMSYIFYDCENLVTAPVIPDSVLKMAGTFYFCYNLSNISKLSNNVITLTNTFLHCYNLVNAPVIPNSVIDMNWTFAYCYNLKNVPSLINCTNLTDMSHAFLACENLVTAPVIPNSVINMGHTFDYCENLTGNIYIYSEQVSNIQDCFFYSSLDKDVYIPFTYANGEFTTTYNTFTQYYSPTNRRSGVLLFDINGL